MAKLSMIYITCPSEDLAKNIAKGLLESRLIACANMLSSLSQYVWKDSIETDEETVLIAKTRDSLYAAVQRYVKAKHPHEVPCIVRIPIEANPEYAAFVLAETRDA